MGAVLGILRVVGRVSKVFMLYPQITPITQIQE
jgi:hypothetical protein